MASEGSGSLYEFLILVNEDPDAYRSDPEGMMDEAKLSDAHRDALRRHERSLIDELLAEEGHHMKGPLYFIEKLK